MSDDHTTAQDPQDEEELYEVSPEEATSLDSSKPGVLNRRRILIAISIFFAVLICGGAIFNSIKTSSKKKTQTEEELQASRSSADFINTLSSRAAYNREKEKEGAQNANQEQTANSETDKSQNDSAEKEPLLPPASISSSSSRQYERPQALQQPQAQQQYYPPPQQSGGGSAPSSGGGEQQQPTHFKSQMVPQVEGRLLAQQPQFQQPSASQQAQTRSPAEEYFAAAGRNSANAYGSYAPSEYDAQNGQQNKQDFLNPQGGENPGFFIGANSVWQGTIIPAILENAINTDLPGDILARVSQNVFDSQTGKNLLIPQGTLLIARYNSSVSYAQHRVQIVWDSLIRPDGFQLTLESNSADKSGMSGQAAKYSENWFEYLKAAGIITLFSIANAKMTESASKVSTPESSGNIAAANSAFVNQIGGNLISRAMNIQPTLTVDNGTPVNVMLNKNLYLPPVRSFPPEQKYILE